MTLKKNLRASLNLLEVSSDFPDSDFEFKYRPGRGSE